MRLGPWLVIRGLVFGNLVVILLTSVLSANASAPFSTGQGNLSQPAAGISPASANCAVSEAFPDSVRQWCGIIMRRAGEHGFPADLLAALIWQESGGDPQATSHSGAVGLMQVMPRDGIAASFQCASGPCFSNRPSSNQLQDPEFNVEYGTRMLAQLVKRHGSLREALKAYGPMDRGYSYADRILGLYRQYGQ